MPRRAQTFILVLLAAGLAAAGCRRQDIRTAVIDVPAMKNAACVERVVGVAGAVPGVLADDVTVDRERRRISVPYNSLKLSLKNIEYAIAEAGFAANDIPADEQARAALPEECR